MSGTSQATAVTTGVVALMLQANPALTPDTVKCRLLASAAPAVTSSGTLAYSVFQQGAGLINAVRGGEQLRRPAAPTQGLNIAADLAGTEHFGGPANQDANGNYYVMNMAGSSWGTPQAGDGYLVVGLCLGPGLRLELRATPGRRVMPGARATPGARAMPGPAATPGARVTPGASRCRGGQTVRRPASATPASIQPWVPNQ